MNIDIAIIEDHKLVGSLLRNELLKCSFSNTVTLYHSPKKFIDAYAKEKFDLLIVDLLMPEVNGKTLIRAVRNTSGPAAKIIVLSSQADVESVKDCLLLGANGYLSKDTEITELEQAIQAIFSGKDDPYIAQSIKEAFVNKLFKKADMIVLTSKEQEVLKFLCEGRQIKDIAGLMYLSVHSIYSYVKRLFRKFEVNRTTDLVLKAIEKGYHLAH